MKISIVLLILGSFSSAFCRGILRDDATYWYSSYVESSSNGPFAISFVCDEGEFVELENMSDERLFLNGWTIKQEVNGKPGISYTFEYCSIQPRYRRRIVPNKMAFDAEVKDFVVTDVDMWAAGQDIQTYLYDQNGTSAGQRTKVETCTYPCYDIVHKCGRHCSVRWRIHYHVCRDIARAGDPFRVWSSTYVETSSDGPFVITGTDPGGRFIELLNLSDERETLDGWTIKQKVKEQIRCSFTFTYCSIGPDRIRKIIPRRWSDIAASVDFIAHDVENWCTGATVKTYLYDRNGTMKAVFIRESVSNDVLN